MNRSYYEDEEEEEEPRELPEVWLATPGACTTCGKPNQRYGCFRCGVAVCYSQINYLADTECGGWILDSWHPAAPDDNEYYCKQCQADYIAEIRA